MPNSQRGKCDLVALADGGGWNKEVAGTETLSESHQRVMFHRRTQGHLSLGPPGRCWQGTCITKFGDVVSSAVWDDKERWSQISSLLSWGGYGPEDTEVKCEC